MCSHSADQKASDTLLQNNFSVHTAQENDTCQITLRINYGKLLLTNELCATVNAGNSGVSKNSSSHSNKKSVCVGDRSGSPLVCDGMLTGVHVDRTKCAPGAVYTYADIAHALQWLRINETTTGEPAGAFDHFDHFVLRSDQTQTWDYAITETSIDAPTATKSTNTLIEIAMNSTGLINTHDTRMQKLGSNVYE